MRPLIAGNWKMNGTGAQLGEVAAVAAAAAGIGHAELLLCPPATLIARAAAAAAGSGLAIGAQDCHPEAQGAFTGDIAAEMLAEAGAAWVILGHSERRHGHGESDVLIAAKAAAAFRAGLSAIVCVGETLEERKAGRASAVVESQIAGSLPSAVDPARLAIAYEPVWAIGTGLTPTDEEIGQMHADIRAWLISRLQEQGAPVRILYGGSVKPANAQDILRLPEVGGALIGGASLKAGDFLEIARVAPRLA